MFLIYHLKKGMNNMNGKEFIKNVHKVAEEKNIDEEVIFDAMTQALTTAYKRNYNSNNN